MRGGIEGRCARLPETILDHLENGTASVLVTGASGSGKTHLLRALASRLGERGVRHVFIRGGSADAMQSLEQPDPGTVVLFDDAELASVEVLRAATQHLAEGGRVVATLTENRAGTGYGERMRHLYEQVPAAQKHLEGTRSIRLEPFTDQQLARLLHRVSPDPLSSVTVEAIQQLSWGLPGVALTLLLLHRSGALTSTPRPRIVRSQSADLHLAPLRHPISIAEERLSPEQVASAVVLAEIGPRSLHGIADVFGAAVQTELFDSGLLLAAPGHDDVFGVPEIYAAAIAGLSEPGILDRIRRTTAEHLLSQEAFGIPLPDREAIFCAGVLSRHDRTAAAAPPPEHHTAFLRRIIDDLISFDEGARARELLLRLGPQSAGLCPLTRARLTTVLRDAHSGLQSLLGTHREREVRGPASAQTEARMARLFLQCQLTAEAGLSAEADPEPPADDRHWADTLLVIRRWNDPDPIGADAPELMRIARTHPEPVTALLAEQLLSLEAVFNGMRYRAFDADSLEQRIGRLAIHSPEGLRDVLSTLIVAQGIIRLFAPGPLGDDPQLRALVDRLPGASRHRIWVTHFFAFRTAFFCGDFERAAMEWSGFVAHAPRFIAHRLRSFLSEVADPSAGGARAGSYSMQVIAYFSGQLDRVRLEAFAETPTPPARSRAALAAAEVGPELEELPHRKTIRGHLDAQRAQNPAALMRAAEALEASGFFAPATHALQEARRIFLRRRASGSVAAADARLAALRAQTEQHVPWLRPSALPEAPRERLTPREAATAELAAEGLSNREIAERMRCSVRTVESHLAQARAKLGVKSRGAMAARLRGSRGTPSPGQHAR